MHKKLLYVLFIYIFAASCIPQYNSKSLFPSKAEIKVTPTLNYPTDNPEDRIAILSKSWPMRSARCKKVIAAMQKEVDSINARNKAIGSAFVGIAAGLATASGLYSALDEDPNPAVTASLSIGAGGTTVPSFFFFGSDEREKLVLLRITEIDDKWETFEKAWNDFQEADRQVAIKRNDLNIEETKKHNIDCNDSPDECQKIDIQIIMLEKVQADTYSKWFAASHAAIQAAEELDRICQ